MMLWFTFTRRMRLADQWVRDSKAERDARNLPDMKQSLRTVATQLLNVSDPNEPAKPIGLENDGNRKSVTNKLVTVAKIERVENTADAKEKSKINNTDMLMKEINSEISSLESIGVSFGRPSNSKFGYFESSHPGQAMAMTDEELEKEMSSKRDMVAYKNQPTTTGGISTWILLNSPTTTPKFLEQETMKPEAMHKFVTKPTASIQRIEVDQKIEQKPTATIEKVVSTQTTTKLPTNSVKTLVNNVRNVPKTTTTKPQMVQTSGQRVTPKPQSSSEPTIPVASLEKNNAATTERAALTTTKKIVPAQRIPQQKLPAATPTTPKPTTKATKPNFNRGKFPIRSSTTVKPDYKVERPTATKIEKVTFRPIQMIPTPKDEVRTELPTLVAKTKTPVSIMLKTTSASPPRSTTPKPIETTTVGKTDFTGSDLIEIPVQTKPPITKVNNVLKVQLKKPVDEATQVQVDAVKVNAPVTKTKDVVADEKVDQGVSQALNNSQVDLKFDFNPELTKIETQESTEQTPVATTTKKPRRSSQKRKKNKNKTRRRRPSSTTTESNDVTTVLIPTEAPIEAAPQESKLEPETKEESATKIKKKQVQKPIGTQIYNYLSREIMPSFGVVSLVGLGLGIASYFLYPFGGGIARRNYEVEPNYKYNLGEYGGNYGQSEEEVFSKVIQGMTNTEAKYNGDQGSYGQNNYYRYQKFGGPAITETKLTRKSDARYPPSDSGLTYKPLENTYDLKYRNTEFKYPEVSTTSNYFERQKQSGYTVANDDDANRQFVVGNVPKEYNYEETPVVGQKMPTYAENGGEQNQFEGNVAQTYVYPKNSANNPILQPYGQPEALPLKAEGSYEEVEITPTAVAVEHGPRALKVKRSIDERFAKFYPRYRRDSVIQVIPHSSSVEVEEKEENLSNEIFDILDLMIPGKDEARKVKDHKISNAIDDEEKIEKKREEDKKTTHETTTKTIVELEDTKTSAKLVATTVIADETSSAAPTSSTTEALKVEDTGTTLASVSEVAMTENEAKDVSSEESVTETEGQDLEETTVEWIDSTTTEKTEKEEEPGFNVFNFVKKVAEIKFRLGLTILKHASEGFARYLGGVQKRINGEE